MTGSFPSLPEVSPATDSGGRVRFSALGEQIHSISDASLRVPSGLRAGTSGSNMVNRKRGGKEENIIFTWIAGFAVWVSNDF